MNKQDKINEYLKVPLKVGDPILVKGFGSQNPNFWGSTTVAKVDGDKIYYKEYGRFRLVENTNVKKCTSRIGINPFPITRSKMRTINYSLDSIYHTLFRDPKYRTKFGNVLIQNVNFDPIVVINGEVKQFQRPFCWAIENKQLLIESIFNDINCGTILIRKRSWNEFEELVKLKQVPSFADVIDGKQRLKTIAEFLNNEFCDIRGDYYKDYSDIAQSRLLNHQLFTYCEMPENTTDEDVLQQFLKLNFAGIPQSKEHLDYVKSLYKSNSN